VIRQNALALLLGGVLIVSVLAGVRDVPATALVLFGLGMFCLLWGLLHGALGEQDAEQPPQPRR
jgi:hypothetical protein